MAASTTDGPGALEGAWAPVAVSVAGQSLEPAELRVRYLLIEGEGYRIIDRSNRVVDSGRYTLNAARTPAAIDIVGEQGPYAGRRLCAVYQLEGDELTLCYDVEGGERPASFAPRRDRAQLLITYERRALGLA